MASGPTVGGDEGPREKQRCVEHKVYTRRAFRGSKNGGNAVNASPSAAAAPLPVPAEANTGTASIVTADPSVTANSSEKKNDDDDNGNIDNSKNDESDTVGNKKDSMDGGKGEDQKKINNNFLSADQAGVPEDNNLTQHPVVKRVEVVFDDRMGLNHQQGGTSNINSLQVDPLNINYHQQDEPLRSYCHQQDEPPSSHSHQPDDPLSTYNHQRDEPVSSSLHEQNEPLSSYHHHREGPLSINHNQKDVVASIGDLPSGNGSMKHGSEGRAKMYLGSRSKHEISDLRRKLESDLDIIRSLMRRIEAKEVQIGRFGISTAVVSNGGGAKRSHSELASVGVPWEVSRPFHQRSASVAETIQEGVNNVEKEKRTPKANQFYRNSEFLLGKYKFPPAESNKKSKTNNKKHGGREIRHAFGTGTKFWKSCSLLLEKLMKHKHGWVFNTPVDVKGLGLHDYYSIISHPMDLGTVKSRLNTNWYKSPEEFAEDVRLTFRNAMTYNPKGQDVHIMAEQLSKIFEDRWTIIESDYNREMRHTLDFGTGIRTTIPLYRKAPLRPPPLDMRRILHRSESMTHSVDRTPKPMTNTPLSRTPAPRKPKANDPHKRDMTYEEKQKLSTKLQSLPSDKLDAIVQIIKRRNSSLFQQDDEIEVDIDSVDTETLWELDRFVTNYKKRLSKHKRKAELASLAKAEAVQSLPEGVQGAAQLPKETEADERNASLPLPTQAEKRDNGNISRSSSSSSSDSGSSSSSDSDTESSSGADSDAGSPRR